MANKRSYSLVIEAGKNEHNYWKDLWNYRELFLFLSWRDILVRYKQTVLGIAWSVIRPFLTMVVFTIIFGKIAKLPSDGVPYPILVYSAMLPWQFFANSFTDASNSLVNNTHMISKIYFPRLIIPSSKIVVGLIDFIISFLILGLIMGYYQFAPSVRILLIPFLIFLAIFTALGAGFWIASLNVKYRDFFYIVPFIVQFGLYISPVGFSSSLVPEKWKLLYSMNPMVGVIDGFRWAILGGKYEIYLPGFILSVGLATMILFSGIWYFRKTEKTFADVI
jgi:lipopolysaccharide transport system permease protein